MSIIVSKSGKNARKLDKTGVESEDYLQRYIYENPESLPLDEYKDDLQLLILAREFPTGSGPIDALGVDQDGEIYLIETKLYKNPDKRLVLAQVLDYGASLWQTYGDPQEFLGRLQEMVAENFDISLREKLEETFNSADWDIDEYLDVLLSNIGMGSFRFVILMDHLEDRLKDLIIYMNQNSRFDVFGVELEFYRHEDLEILIPKLFGSEIKKTVSSSSDASSRKKWNEQKFFKDAKDRLNSDEVEKIRSLYVWAQEKSSRIGWGTGVQRGSFNPKFDHVSPKSVFTVYSDGTIQLNFVWLTEPEHTAVYAKELGEKLKGKLEVFSIPTGFIDEHISVPLENWGPHLSEFINILEDVLFKEPSSKK